MATLLISHQSSSESRRNRRPGMATLLALTAGLSMGLWATSAQAQTGASGQGAAKSTGAGEQTETEDTLIFRSGQVLTGRIVSETPTSIRFSSKTASGIAFEVDYERSTILEVKRGVRTDAPKGAEAAKASATPEARATPAPASSTPRQPVISEGQERVYYFEISGTFGEQISETPLREIMEDAKANKADVVIIKVNNFWDIRNNNNEELPDEIAANFDESHRAERMMPYFDEVMKAEWEKPPRLVFWVKKAMGGPAFFPLVSRDIYFSPEGKLGGIGNLDHMMRGHERVVEKQISLRLQRAVGWALKGGYPELLVRAMCKRDQVLSVKIENGKPVFLERMPESPDEELLTDDGKEGNQDSIQQLARMEGNDNLTLNARTAQLVGFSRGTVSTREELLAALGLDRNGVVIEGRAARIQENWNGGLSRAREDILRLFREYGEVQVEAPGEYQQRTAARNTRINRLTQVITLLKRWKEALDPGWLNQNGVPLTQDGEPDIAALELIIKQIRTEQALDRRR